MQHVGCSGTFRHLNNTASDLWSFRLRASEAPNQTPQPWHGPPESGDSIVTSHATQSCVFTGVIAWITWRQAYDIRHAGIRHQMAFRLELSRFLFVQVS